MTQEYICDPERVPVCRCDDEGFCGCSPPNVVGNCDCCGSPMRLINVDTGAPVEAKAS